MKQKKLKRKDSKGITLIALVITIIVLLILAGISIATLTGENGLLGQAKSAKEKTEIAEVIERAQTDILSLQAENYGKITKDQLKTVLDKYFKDVPDPLPDDFTTVILTAKEEYGGYKNIALSDIYKGSLSTGGNTTSTYDPNTLTIGEAINPEDYGRIVTNYEVKKEETGGWRLFYQDSNYTYIISNNCTEKYAASGDITNYPNGTNVSTEGKRLNSKLLQAGTFFTADNKNSNIRATAWLTDTSDSGIWKDYQSIDAVFAIGCPTIELLQASYNTMTTKTGTIELDLGDNGYSYSTPVIKAEDNGGIYNNGTPCWLASPSDSGSAEVLCILSNGSVAHTISSNLRAARPVVCIPTSVFNSRYILDSK